MNSINNTFKSFYRVIAQIPKETVNKKTCQNSAESHEAFSFKTIMFISFVTLFN